MTNIAGALRLGVVLVVLAATMGKVEAQPAAALSSSAERVYAATRPKLLQIRTLVAEAEQQSSIGSGFLVSADGLAITNYHVVSQYALEPGTYRLEYATAEGRRGELKLLAIDIADDLAVVRLDLRDQPFLEFDDKMMADAPKGERLYSMGNPLDLGFTIVEGTYNGRVERSYSERIHFSGAINPGMSGGPTVTEAGRVVGINVAKQLGGELVSFLVPAHFAAALLDHARAEDTATPPDFRREIGQQLAAWQARLYGSIGEFGFRAASSGPYFAPESAAPWFTCWAQTNADQRPKPRATINTTNCNSDTRLFVASDLNTGLIHIAHSYLRDIDLNEFQFATFLSQHYQLSWFGGWTKKWQTPPQCHEDVIAAAEGGDQPALRTLWCVRAYRAFEGIYDVSVIAVTQDRGSEALVSRLGLQGVSYENAVALTRRFLDAVRWAR